MSYRIREWMGIATLAGCVLATSGVRTCGAQEGEGAAEIKERITHMLGEAEELKRAGRLEAAERMVAEATELREHLERRIGGEEGRRQRLLARVEGAVGALNELGRPEEAEQLARTLQSLARPEREGDRRERDENPELRAARQQLEVLNVALEALASADRGDAAGQLARAIQALHVGIEGRRDEEALAMLRSAPSRGAQAELLAMASSILEERGRVDRARVVGEFAQRLARTDREVRARREGETREGREIEDRERVADHQRLEMLEARLREVTNAVEQLHAELRELRRER